MTTESRKPPSAARGSLSRRILSGAGWGLFAKALSAISLLAINAILARMLTPADMGAYFILVSTTVFAAVVARMGCKETTVRIVAEAMTKGLPGQARQGLKRILVIVSAGALVVGVLFATVLMDWLAGPIFNMPVLATVGLLVAIWIVFLTYQTPVAETFRGLHDIRLAVLFDGVLSSVFLAILLVILFVAGVTVGFETTIMLTTAAAGTSLIIGAVLLARQRALFLGPGDMQTTEVLHMSMPLYAANVAWQASSSAQLWIAGILLDAAEVALFGAALSLVRLVLLPLRVMNMSVQPLISELHTLNARERLQTALRGSATLSGLPALAVLLVFILGSGTVMELVYGAPYRDAAVVLIVLSIGSLSLVWAGSSGHVLTFTGHQRELMILTLIASVVSIALVIAGGYYFGLIGCAVAYGLARIFQAGLIWWQAKRLTGYWTHATLHPAYLREAWQRLRGSRSAKRSAP